MLGGESNGVRGVLHSAWGFGGRPVAACVGADAGKDCAWRACLLCLPSSSSGRRQAEGEARGLPGVRRQARHSPGDQAE